ncbi:MULTISPECIES: hypothetical protein [Acetobacter]|uniref:Transglycosylase SLT domain-containing protein n=2 Tax=Acetobacter TaxID=434 RepID=A0A511XQ60_9PROT|nr:MULTISPECIES: hypothetical protein [Acetobacter]MBB3884749.1 hypothetical protein [Acetobacter oeni]MBV1838745.1 hypothetical protein [Acetobacter estunensis]NHN86711.1 hypothetical protein [Acetobacter musti]NHO20505.1 hypothetical protein [Acetobacter oeni]GBR07857.1 hypothetical protein AA21952_2463 [Acetobacter oeni LMG 21952]
MRIGQKWYLRSGIALGVLASALGGGVPAWAQVTLNGPPIQVTPYVSEPGVPTVTITPGSTNPLGGDTDPNGGGAGGSTGTGTSTSAGSSDALNTLLAQSWGATAVSEAEAVGVNPSALAATCVAESGCTNAGTNGTATGAFQMQPAAFQDGLATALAADPALASQIVQGSAGQSDPTTEAIAASGYLMQANTALTSAGVTNPTVLDARAYYNFGPNAGVQIAQAPPTALMSDYISSAALSGNNISATETVAQWQSSVSSKIGNAASQTVLS